MSKLGKKKIQIPKDVSVNINGDIIDLKGPNGTNKIFVNSTFFNVNYDKENLSINPKKINENTKREWGLNRSLINNAIIGITKGYEKILELNGVGFRATIQGSKLNLQLGLSHPVEFEIPKEIKITVEKQTTLKITGIDKQLVGMISSKIMQLKPVEPYKGKGIKEKGQYVLRKEGKKK